MSDATKNNDEPSIEEILGSIRRIIADDEDQPGGAPASASVASPSPSAGFAAALHQAEDQEQDDEEDTPLELTQKLDEDGTVIDLQETAAHGYDEDENPLVAAVPDVLPVEAVSPAAAPPSFSADEITMIDDDEPVASGSDTLVSSVAADATAAVMAKLARNSMINRPGNEGATIEDLVKDMLRPMLRVWLDENLPDMVQSMVERELEKIARRVG